MFRIVKKGVLAQIDTVTLAGNAELPYFYESDTLEIKEDWRPPDWPTIKQQLYLKSMIPRSEIERVAEKTFAACLKALGKK
jgi:hypothetical protein